MNRKFQAFVSSTYQDLRDERTKVINTLLTHDCIPTGMEFFTAMNEEQFQYIKKIIDLCDYYILIIGGMYGSISISDGISYTEKEYDYAMDLFSKKGELEVFAFIHEHPEKLPGEKLENYDESKEKLNKFKEKVKKNKLVRFWNNPDELGRLVGESISAVKTARPKSGWVKDFPISTNFPEYYDRLKNNLTDFKNKTIHQNQNNEKYKLLIYDWIMQNKYEQTIESSDQSININILQPGEKSRKLFGGIITTLGSADKYHTLSSLAFWTNDLENNEKKFIEDNIEAIDNGVEIERVILVDKDIFLEIDKNKTKLLALDNLIKDLLNYIDTDDRIYNQIKTKFVEIESSTLNKLEEVPFATIFCNVKLKGNSFDLESFNEDTCIMQIVSYKDSKTKPLVINGLKVNFFNERTSSKICKLESKFLEYFNNLNALDVYQMNNRLNKLQIDNPFRPSSKDKNKDYYIIYNDLYSIVECKFLKDVSKKLNNSILKLKNKDDSYFTLIDTGSVVSDLVANQEIEIKSDSFPNKLRELHNWRMIKIEKDDAINLTGVIHKISDGFKTKEIPICLFTVYDGVYLFIRKEFYSEAKDYLAENYILKYFEGETPF